MRISRAAKCCTRSCLRRTESTTRVGYHPPPSHLLLLPLLPLLLHLSFFLFCIASLQSQSCSCVIKYAAQHLICFFVFMFTLYFLNPPFTLSAACFGWYHAALPGILAPSSCIKLAPPSHPPSHFITPHHTLAHLGPSWPLRSRWPSWHALLQLSLQLSTTTLYWAYSCKLAFSHECTI